MLEMIANSIGIAYLMVLGVLGYVILLVVINRAVSNKLLRVTIIALHFICGITAIMLFPSVHYHDTLTHYGTFASILFASVVLLGLVVVFGALSFINKHIGSNET